MQDAAPEPGRDPLGIVELGRVCAEQRARSLAWFARLGTLVTATGAGPIQRAVATAAHRHAWHADLWAARTPAIPPVDPPADPTGLLPAETSADDGWLVGYRTELTSLAAELDRLAARVDPALDPSTTRTITLVRRDIAETIAELDQVG